MVETVKYEATGRRKSSVARVDLTPGTGQIKVNDRPFATYFKRETDRLQIVAPLSKVGAENKFDIFVRVNGGGTSGQAGAMRLAISRALINCDTGNRPVLKKSNFLTRDPRMKERKKPGQKGARRKFQWVKR